MILISTERCGSEWFIDGLLGFEFSGFEMFQLDVAPDVVNPYLKIPIQDKILELQDCPINRVQKIHASHIFRQHHKNAAAIKRVLMGRGDVYLLERRNKRRQIISYLLAVLNNNYHSDRALSTRGRVSRPTFDLVCQRVMLAPKFLQSLKYKERFVYEDLMSGSAVPRTLEWSAEKSKVIRRGSRNFEYLITNLDEVNLWFKEHGI